MADKAILARDVLNAVGGKDNVTFVAHCITRLRFNLKDESIVDDDAICKISGVVGTKRVAGQYQVIVGTGVDEVYNEVLKLVGTDKGAGEVDPDPEDIKNTNLVSRLMKLISGIMMPVLPALIACGLINAIATVTSQMGIVAQTDGIYILLSSIGNVCLYFFPVLVGSSAAKFFGIDQYIGAIIGAALIYPTFVNMANAGEMLNLFGIQLSMVSYTSTVFPAIVATWFASILYKGFKRIMPEVISYAITPALTVLIAAPLSLLIIGPVINNISALLASAFMAIYGVSPVVCALILVPLFGMVLIPLGLHWALMVLAINNLTTLGADPILGLVCCSLSVCGVCLAYGLRSKDPDQRSLGFSTAVTAFFGITEPALYGIILPHKRIIIANLIAGVIPSIIPALFNTRTFTMTGSGIFSFPGYMNPSGDAMSFVGAVLANVVGFVLAFIVTYVALGNGAPEKKNA